MRTTSKRALNSLTARPEPGIFAEPAPTAAEIDCYIGRLEVTLVPPASRQEGMPDGRRDPYQFD